MSIERMLRGIAGAFVTASVILAYYHSPWWLLFTLFVGVNLFQSAFTDWCLMMNILKAFGLQGEHERAAAAQRGGAR
jgi:hypothetical protein